MVAFFAAGFTSHPVGDASDWLTAWHIGHKLNYQQRPVRATLHVMTKCVNLFVVDGFDLCEPAKNGKIRDQNSEQELAFTRPPFLACVDSIFIL